MRDVAPLSSWPLSLLLVLNALWLGAGAWQFGLRSTQSTYGLVATADATPQGRLGIAASFRFLGGLNLALAALAVMTLLRQHDLGADLMAIPLAALAIAHTSQFLVNLPVAVTEWRGGRGPWRVGQGLMRLIFVGDAALAVADILALVAPR